MAAPTAAAAAFRAALEAALEGAQDVDKPTTYAAAEVMAGLLASGALFSAAGGTVWARAGTPRASLMALSVTTKDEGIDLQSVAF